jgi:hypothetical protein
MDEQKSSTEEKRKKKVTIDGKSWSDDEIEDFEERLIDSTTCTCIIN